MAPSRKIRLDELLVLRGLAPSKAQAKALVMSGRVRTGTVRLDKPGKDVSADLVVEVEQPPRFVSRGGEKLAAALAAFGIDLHGAQVLDLGASTGGFSDCALQAGAAAVTCVDVGRAQLHQRLRDDPRVTNLEQVNVRHLRPGDLPRGDYGCVVMDLSFISLKLTLPAAWGFVSAGGLLVALIKPQFEAGKEEVDRGRGVIRDPAVHERVVSEMTAFVAAELAGARILGVIESPLTGADGNREFLIGLRRAGPGV